MLQELVSSSTAAFDESAVRTASMTSAASQRLDQGISALSSAQGALTHHGAQHSEAVSSLIASSSAAFSGDMSVVSTQRQTADSVLATVSGMVGSKRKFLDCTVTELCAHVDGAIQQGVSVVDATSATASKVLSDVSSASQAMNASASSAMDTFTTFMDQEGEALSSGLDTHFSAVETHSATQTADLSALQKAGGIHRETIQESKVQATGATPRKVQPGSFEGPFKRTRSHGLIRNIAKQSLLPPSSAEEGSSVDGAATLNYEVAKQGIAECTAMACAAVDADAEEEPAELEMEVAVAEVAELPAFPAAIARADSAEAEVSVRGRSSSVSTMSTTSSSRLSKESSTSDCSGGSGGARDSTEGAELGLLSAGENANPNITTTRNSRGTSKGRGGSSKIAALGRSTRNAPAAAAAHEPLGEI